MKGLLIFIFFFCSLFAEEGLIEEEAREVNIKANALKEELEKNFAEVLLLHKNKAEEREYQELLEKIKRNKRELFLLRKRWKEETRGESSTCEEGYSFWNSGETTLSRLIMEYGSEDFLYVIPYEVGSIKISVYSSLMIPAEAWDEMLEFILAHNGIGIKKINPYLKHLFLLKHDPSYIEAIVQKPEELGHFSDRSYIFYVMSPTAENMREIFNFFDRFADPKQTTVQIVGSKIAIVSNCENIKRLVQLYEAVWEKKQDKEVKIITLTKIGPEEVEKILKPFFSNTTIRGRSSLFSSAEHQLVLLPLVKESAIAIVGSHFFVERAERVIEDLETQMKDPSEVTLFWYPCKHSDPNEIAETLNSIYSSFKNISFDYEQPEMKKKESLPVSPPSVEPGKGGKPIDRKEAKNFVVDAKSGSILILSKRSELETIKTILKKLDVPKKMVQIDILLLEKKVQDQRQMGINLLKIGDVSSNQKKTGLSFDTDKNAKRKGILDFILDRAKGSLPAFDMTLSFLMAQEDVKIQANPSVLAVNQTPTMISIVEEISINNGAVEFGTSNCVTVEKSFTRAQFGINIVVTPTIHLGEIDEEGKSFITLKTDVTFDTTQSSEDDRPPVTRRHIENEVRVADGETIILGGLRKQTEEDKREKIPFLGEIKGIGKLFGSSKLADFTTEMFIFITPRIIRDPVDDLNRIRKEELKKRPGDIPEFLRALEKAKKREKENLVKDSMIDLFS